MSVAQAERAAWLRQRRLGVGASDVAGILGLSKWASPYSVWLSKITDVPDEQNDDTEFGRRAERMVLDWFEDKTGLYALNRGQMVHHPEHPKFFATVDALAFEHLFRTIDVHHDFLDPSDAIALVEAKTTTDSAAEWEREIPIYYRVQVTWAMWCAGLDHAFIPTLHRFSGQFRLYEIALDPTDVEFIVPRVTAFWQDHVLTGDPPPVDAHPATTEALKQRWPTPEGSLDADERARELVARYRTAQATTKLAEETEQRIGNELRALLGDSEALVDGIDVKGHPNVIASWRASETRRLDAAALRAAHPELADEFTTTTSARRLLAHTPKGN